MAKGARNKKRRAQLAAKAKKPRVAPMHPSRRPEAKRVTMAELCAELRGRLPACLDIVLVATLINDYSMPCFCEQDYGHSHYPEKHPEFSWPSAESVVWYTYDLPINAILREDRVEEMEVQIYTEFITYYRVFVRSTNIYHYMSDRSGRKLDPQVWHERVVCLAKEVHDWLSALGAEDEDRAPSASVWSAPSGALYNVFVRPTIIKLRRRR